MDADVTIRFHIDRILCRLIGVAEAEDVLQVTFAKVHEALPRFRNESTVGTWIFRIATNAAFDHVRKNAGVAAVTEPVDDEGISESAPNPEETAAQQEVSACIASYVDQLPLAWRTVLVLSEHEGLTNQEIADTLGISIDNVKIRLHRARARLKSELERGCHVYRDERNVLTCEPKPQPVSFRR